MQPIRKLDTQLANQIAAGEVVERPASVVKELLENSLDAGANRIDIEVISGGTSLIRIRDNGSGIPRQQLELALSPHATSKITSLDDLDDIRSFGFRGEALSSICSISKFSLSSRTIDAEQGWQAQTQGRDMKVTLTPVAVAQGTRIDVRELFFNTPARRRFLRTEKTEFSHIEDVVKKVALANFTVALTLKHNGRMSRRFRAAHDLLQQEQRVAAVCSRKFMQRSIRLDLEHQGVELSGWLALPDYHKSQTDGQYLYVNNRPVRDKVLNHAIRLAYQNYIPQGRVPAYVLFLTINPRKVDINVHPTKHEVRFHDGRFIHDMLVQAVERGLSEGKELLDDKFLDRVEKTTFEYMPAGSGAGTVENRQQHQAYCSLLQAAHEPESEKSLTEPAVTSGLVIGEWQYLTRLDDKHLLLERNEELVLLSIPDLLKDSFEVQKSIHSAAEEKLLFPEIIYCSEQADTTSKIKLLNQFGIHATAGKLTITIEKVPSWLPKNSIKLISYELIKAFCPKQDVSGQKNSEQEIANCLLTLLQQSGDMSNLRLKKISKKYLLDFFPTITK